MMKHHHQNISCAAFYLRKIRNYSELNGAEHALLDNLLERLEKKVSGQLKIDTQGEACEHGCK